VSPRFHTHHVQLAVEAVVAQRSRGHWRQGGKFIQIACGKLFELLIKGCASGYRQISRHLAQDYQQMQH